MCKSVVVWLVCAVRRAVLPTRAAPGPGTAVQVATLLRAEKQDLEPEHPQEIWISSTWIAVKFNWRVKRGEGWGMRPANFVF